VLLEPTDEQLHNEAFLAALLEEETDLFEVSDIHQAAREAYIEDFYYSSNYTDAFKEWLNSHES
jgi:hypothetical protein